MCVCVCGGGGQNLQLLLNSAQLSSPASQTQHTLWAECKLSFSGFAYFEQRGCCEMKANYCFCSQQRNKRIPFLE